MNKIKAYLFCVLGGTFIISAYAQNKDPNVYALMTARDVKDSSLSNITITNHAGQPVSVAGLYIASFDINDCSACSGSVVGGDNLGGAIPSPIDFKTGQTLAIGQNYLYNMIYSGIYYIKHVLLGPAPCSLPGCSWPTDNSTVHGWCITINVASRNSSYTYSNYKNGSHLPAAIPPYGEAGLFSPYDYNYALINPATLGSGSACLGPIVCNDKTLTCTVSSPQNESFQPY